MLVGCRKRSDSKRNRLVKTSFAEVICPYDDKFTPKNPRLKVHLILIIADNVFRCMYKFLIFKYVGNESIGFFMTGISNFLSVFSYL